MGSTEGAKHCPCAQLSPQASASTGVWPHAHIFLLHAHMLYFVLFCLHACGQGAGLGVVSRVHHVGCGMLVLGGHVGPCLAHAHAYACAHCALHNVRTHVCDSKSPPASARMHALMPLPPHTPQVRSKGPTRSEGGGGGATAAADVVVCGRGSRVD